MDNKKFLNDMTGKELGIAPRKSSCLIQNPSGGCVTCHISSPLEQAHTHVYGIVMSKHHIPQVVRILMSMGSIPVTIQGADGMI